MKTDVDERLRSGVTDWLCAALAVGAFFVYVLVIGFAPEIFRRPVTQGSLVSVGLASGIVLTVFLVSLAGVYTYLRNKESRK